MFRQRAQLLLSRTLSFATTVVATSDYVSPNKPTDCCGTSTSVTFNNNNSGQNGTSRNFVEHSPPPPRPVHFDDSSNGSGSHRASATTVDGTGGVNAYWKDVFSDTSKLIPNFGTTPNAATHDYVSPNKTIDCCGGIVDVHPYPHPPYHDQPYHHQQGPSRPQPMTPQSQQQQQHPPYEDYVDDDDSATSGAMSNYIEARYFSESLSSSNDMGDDFTESLSFSSSSAAIKQNIILEFWRDKFRNKLEVLPDLNISASTMNVPSTTTPNVQTTTTHKRKGKRKGRYDIIEGEYVVPSDDCQDYSKSHRLVYEKGHPAKRLKSDGAAMDIEKFIEGRGVLHATSAKNLFSSPTANLAPHIFGNLDGGIFANGLKPLVQADKKSKKPMEAVWVMPYGRGTSSIAHIVNTHGPALKESGGWVALIMIPADDDRIKNFTPFRSGSNFSKKCHPAYSYGEIPVSPKDVLIVNINDLPVFLKETKVRTDLIPLKTDDEKKATRVLSNAKWYHNEGGKEKRAKTSAKWYHNGGGRESAAARYAASTNRPVKRHTHTRGPQCTDFALGPNGMFKYRLDTTLSHSHSKKKGDRPRCALHRWAGKSKTGGIVHCETCNVHLCTDCFTTFHTHVDLVAVKKQLLKTDLKKLVPLKTEPKVSLLNDEDPQGKRRLFPRVKHLISNKEWEDFLTQILECIEQAGAPNCAAASNNADNAWYKAFDLIYGGIASEYSIPTGKNRYLKFKDKIMEVWVALETQEPGQHHCRDKALGQLARHRQACLEAATQKTPLGGETPTSRKSQRTSAAGGPSSASSSSAAAALGSADEELNMVVSPVDPLILQQQLQHHRQQYQYQQYQQYQQQQYQYQHQCLQQHQQLHELQLYDIPPQQQQQQLNRLQQELQLRQLQLQQQIQRQLQQQQQQQLLGSNNNNISNNLMHFSPEQQQQRASIQLQKQQLQQQQLQQNTSSSVAAIPYRYLFNTVYE